MSNTFWKTSSKCQLGLCFSAILGFAGSAYAAGDAVETGKFELTVTEATVGGNEIIAGDMSAAIEKINTTISFDSSYEKNSNLCAAYTAQGKFATAKPHCESALKFSKSSHYRVIGSSRSYASQRNRQAMALNNLGVWHAMQGDVVKAQAYFERAASRSQDMVATSSRNIEVLELRMGADTVAAN